MRGPRARAAAALLGLAAVVFVVLQLWPRATPPATNTKASHPDAWSPPIAWQPAEMHQAALPAPTSRIALIERVRADRVELCTNETALVEVDARDPRDPPSLLRISIGGRNAGSRAAARFSSPGEQRLSIVARTVDGIQDSRWITFNVHDCGDRFQFVAVRAEGAEGLDNWRFAALPYFDRPECASKATRAEIRQCDATPIDGETLTYHWDFGDGTKAEGGRVVDHSYAERVEDELESSFVVRVDVESSLHGTITGFANVVIVNASVGNKQRAGVITPTFVLGERLADEARSRVWRVTARNPDRTTLQLDDVEITLSPCTEGESRSVRRPARRLLDDTTLAPGITTTRARLPAEDIGPDDCFASFKVTGSAPGGFVVQGIFGARVSDVGAITIEADETNPDLKRRYDRSVRALRILGRGLDGGPATVSDDEIRKLELEGKL